MNRSPALIHLACEFALLLLLWLVLPTAALTPSEEALRDVLGEGTPVPVPLWAGQPPKFLTNAPPETVDEHARIKSVSVPTLSVSLPPKDKRTGMAIIVCAGGGYGGLDWRTHVHFAAEVFNAQGVAVIGLKYRTRPPHLGDNASIQALTLLDAQRAVRLVRHRSAEWGIDPRKVGVAGYSAGANLAMNLAANFDAGDAQATDPVERLRGHGIGASRRTRSNSRPPRRRSISSTPPRTNQSPSHRTSWQT